jgi:hypothetical protein
MVEALNQKQEFFFPLEISFRQLLLCCFVAPHLTRGLVYNLLVQLFLGLARAVTFGSKSRKTHGHIYCLIWDSPNMEGQVPVFISPNVGDGKDSLCPSQRGHCDRQLLPLVVSNLLYINLHWQLIKIRLTLCMLDFICYNMYCCHVA